ncbi:helix-turn-helix domain-containing protein [Bdellovibrio sp.]|uniref:helix-turn-helix domain-containing protein n=1 Tax=Bdellovibrio sp. TaxID=28201 RepID=UPI0039E4B790
MIRATVAVQTGRVIHLAGRRQKDIAKEANITDATLSRFLGQKADIKLSTFEAILSCLKIDLSDLIQREVSRILGLREERSRGDVDQLLASLPKSKRKNALEHLLVLSKGVKSQEIQEIRLRLEHELKK